MTHAPNEPCLDKRDSRQMPDEIWAYKTCGAVYTSVVNAEHIKNYDINAEYIRADLVNAKAMSDEND